MSPRGLAAILAAALSCAAALADESPPLTAPKGTPKEKAIAAYNEGVKLMLDRRYAEAERRFEGAIALDDGIAEAHNNLAFSLRMQGRANFERSLREYQRALEINPRLAQAYMYRGVLHTQMGNAAAARADLEVLQTLDPALAMKLQKAIAAESRDDRDGLAGQIDNLY